MSASQATPLGEEAALADGLPNEQIASTLGRISALLEFQRANRFRVAAYRNAADTVREAPESLAEAARAGDLDTVRKLPRSGAGLARLSVEIAQTGRPSLLIDLETAASPLTSLAQVPGMGQDGAKAAVAALGITTLQDLEVAAHDGRLATVAGFDQARVDTVKVGLAGILSRSIRRRASRRGQKAVAAATEPTTKPAISLLLELDAEYRAGAEAGTLRTIAPKRFNPLGQAWLPVLETEREGWHFTLLFSNTARAHELGTTHDWVVIYYERDGLQLQATAVTATKGPLAGKRVIRGREPECRDHYGLPR